MYGDPELWADLLDRLADITATFLKVQIEAGASAVQLFDSWVGRAGPRRLPALGDARLGEGLRRRRPLRRTAHPLRRRHRRAARADGRGGRGRRRRRLARPLDEAARRVGPGKALQGNLDPAVLFAPPEAVEAKTREVLDAAAGLEGHVFNLGHGVMPATDPDALTRLVEYVHTRTAR